MTSCYSFLKTQRFQQINQFIKCNVLITVTRKKFVYEFTSACHLREKKEVVLTGCQVLRMRITFCTLLHGAMGVSLVAICRVAALLAETCY